MSYVSPPGHVKLKSWSVLPIKKFEQYSHPQTDVLDRTEGSQTNHIELVH